MAEWHLRPGRLSLKELRHLLGGRVRLSIESAAWPGVEAWCLDPDSASF
mgnify:CR=1 FL=1